MKEENIKVKGYTDTWYIIDREVINFKQYYLLENEVWGDETCHLVTDKDFNVICETFDDIETALEDKGII